MAYPGNHTESEILRVPRNLKTRPHAPETKLAYITPEEEGILQALKPGTPHKGPEGIPNYDTWEFDPDSGALTGGSTAGGGGAWSGDPGGTQDEPEPITYQGGEDKPPKDEEKPPKDEEDKPTIMQTIMGGGVGGDLDVEKEDFKAPGKHKARAFHDYMVAKYGEKWLGTTQGQNSIRQLMGIPASKGGGLGLQDPQYGGGITNLDPTAEALRQAILSAQAEHGTVNLKKALLGPSNAVYGPARGNLTPSQYQNFMQQVHQANPAAFEKAFPGSSGALPGKLFEMAISPMKTVGTGILQSLGLAKEKEPDPMYAGEALDPSLFHDLAQIEDQGQGEDVAQNIVATEYDIPTLPSEGDEFDLASSLYDWDLYNQYLQSLGGIPTHGAQGGEVQGYRGGGLSELVSDNDMSYNNAIGDFMQRRKYDI